uniref:Non-specific serine/threonine protein kinase n=1 Tax=Rhabditophanes sp. KR3021 TaxID=114890 RepID=A0AC35U0S9_9BILA
MIFFKKYSLPLIKEAFTEYLKLDTVELVSNAKPFGAVGGLWDAGKEYQIHYVEVRLCQLLLYFLDRPELGYVILNGTLDLFLNFVCKLNMEEIKKFEKECESVRPLVFVPPWINNLKEAEENRTLNGNEGSGCKTNLKRIELVANTFNMLLKSLDPGFIWQYLGKMFGNLLDFEYDKKHEVTFRLEATNDQMNKEMCLMRRMNENLRLFPLMVKFCCKHVELNVTEDVRYFFLPQLLKTILGTLKKRNFNLLSKDVFLSIIVVCRDLLKEVSQSSSAIETGGDVVNMQSENNGKQIAKEYSTKPREQKEIEECLEECKELAMNIAKWYVDSGRQPEKAGPLLAVNSLLHDFCDFPIYSQKNVMVYESDKKTSQFSEWLNQLLKVVDIHSWSNKETNDVDVRCQVMELIVYLYAKSAAVLEQHRAVHGRDCMTSYRAYVGGNYGTGDEKTTKTVLLKAFIKQDELLRFQELDYFRLLSEAVWNTLDDNVGLSHNHQCCSKLMLILHSLKVNEASSEAEDTIVCDLTSRCIASSIRAAKKFRNVWTLNRSISTSDLSCSIPIKQFNRVYLVLLGVLADESLSNGGSQLKNIVTSWLMDCAKHNDLQRVMQMLVKMLLNPSTSRVSIHYVDIVSRLSSDEIPGMPNEINVVNLKTTTAGQEIHHVCKIPGVNNSATKDDGFIDLQDKKVQRWVNDSKKKLKMPFSNGYDVSKAFTTNYTSSIITVNTFNDTIKDKTPPTGKIRYNRTLSEIPHFDEDDDVDSLDNVSMDSSEQDIWDCMQFLIDQTCQKVEMEMGISGNNELEIIDLFKHGLKEADEQPAFYSPKPNYGVVPNGILSTPGNSIIINGKCQSSRREATALKHQISISSAKAGSICRKGHRRQDSLQQSIYDMAQDAEVKNFNPAEISTLTAAGDEKQQLFDEQHTHMLLYSHCGKKVDLGRTERVFAILRELLKSNRGSTMLGRHIVTCMISFGTSSLTPESGTISQVLDLFLRHIKVIQGQEFWANIHNDENNKDHSINNAFDANKKRDYYFLELFITIALYYLRSCYLNSPINEVTQSDLLDAWKCKRAALDFLNELTRELIHMLRDSKSNSFATLLQSILHRCKLSRCLKLFLLAAVRTDESQNGVNDKSGKPTAILSAEVLDFNDGPADSEFFVYAIQAYHDALLDFAATFINLEYELRNNLQNTCDDEQPVHSVSAYTSTPLYSFQQCQTPPGRNHSKENNYECLVELKVFLCVLLKALQKKPERHERWLQFTKSILPFLDKTLKTYCVHIVDQLTGNLRVAIGAAYSYTNPSLHDDRLSMTSHTQSETFENSQNVFIDTSTGSYPSRLDLRYNANMQVQVSAKAYPVGYCVMILEALTSIMHYCVVDNTDIDGPQPSPNVSSTSGGAHNLSAHLTGSVYGMVGSAIYAVPGTKAAAELFRKLNPFTFNDAGPANTVAYTQIDNRFQSNDWRDAREEILKILPHIVHTLTDVWSSIVNAINKCPKASSNARNHPVNVLNVSYDFSDGYSLEPKLPLGTPNEIGNCLIDLLSPLSQSNQQAFLNAMALVWLYKSDRHNSRTQNRNGEDCTHFAYTSDQMDLISLLLNIKALSVEYVINVITETLRDTASRSSKQVTNVTSLSKGQYGMLNEVNMLELLHGCIKQLDSDSSEFKALWNSLFSLISDSPINNLPPRGVFLLFIIFADYVRLYGSASIIEDKSISSSMQSCCQRLTDALNNIVGWQLEQTTWLKRTLVVKQDSPTQIKHSDMSPGNDYKLSNATISEAAVSIRASTTSLTTAKLSSLEGTLENRQTSTLVQSNSTSLSQLPYNTNIQNSETKSKLSGNPRASLKDGHSVKHDPINSTQALFLLAENLAELIDSICKSEDKEKLIPTLHAVWANTLPFLREKKARNSNFFLASSQFLASISSFNYMRAVWKKTTLDLFMDSAFFKMNVKSLKQWLVVIDNLMANDKTSLAHLFSKLPSSQNSALPNLIVNKEQGYDTKSQALKRLGFVILSSRIDQYSSSLAGIQDRLTECLKLTQVPSIFAQVFTIFRVLLIRLSPNNVVFLWPSMITELVHVLLQIENQLSDSNAAVTDDLKCAKDEQWMQLYLSACKLLETLCTLPSGYMPQFQMCHWAFVSSVARSPQDMFIPFAIRIDDSLKRKYGPLSDRERKELSASLREVKTLVNFGDLRPFFSALVDQHKTLAAGITGNYQDGQLREASYMNGSMTYKNSLARLENSLYIDFAETWQL